MARPLHLRTMHIPAIRAMERQARESARRPSAAEIQEALRQPEPMTRQQVQKLEATFGVNLGLVWAPEGGVSQQAHPSMLGSAWVLAAPANVSSPPPAFGAVGPLGGGAPQPDLFAAAIFGWTGLGALARCMDEEMLDGGALPTGWDGGTPTAYAAGYAWLLVGSSGRFTL